MTAINLSTDNLTSGKSSRIELVDALRGFALLAIVLLHNLEHYNVFGTGSWQPAWLNSLGSSLTEIFYFLLAGKAYATFSLLFGLSFYIQMRNTRKRGCDYRARFAWRMLILVGFSQFHALFYNGDILLLYAVCGLILIPASSWSNRTVIIVASLLMLQPYAWGKIIYALFNPDYVDTNSMFATFAASAEAVGRDGNFIQTLANNIWNGQLYSNFWQVEAGRLFQTPALFLFGMWLGRRNAFTPNANNTQFWKHVATWAAIACIPLYLLKTFIPPMITNITILSYYGIAVPMLFNFSMMALLVSLICLLWFRANDTKWTSWLKALIPYGRMSLTNYIFQSIIGVIIYYHFGFDLYDKVGGTLSLAIGFGIFFIQLWFSRKWLAAYGQGPLEKIWKRLTWFGFTQQSSPDKR